MNDLQLCFGMDLDQRTHLPVVAAAEPPTTPIVGRSRLTDHQTSHDAGRNMAKRYKWGSMRHRLLEVYASKDQAITDEDACSRAGLTVGGWKRCSELRASGYIADTGETALTLAGVRAQCCAITDLGRTALEEIRFTQRRAS